MALSEREPDGTLWLMQDEMCGHILLIPADEDDVYEWDYAREKRFASEEEAVAWHDANCPELNKKNARELSALKSTSKSAARD